MTQTNYLANKAPELKKQFVDALKKIPLFQGMQEEQMQDIFAYSRFVHLKPNQTLFKQGNFDQSVYLLLNGSLDIYLNTGKAKAQRIDTLNKPFNLIGEHCILGKAQGVTALATTESLLVGTDLSNLPDVLEAFENPETLLEDKEYTDNISIYILLGTVLAARVDRLIKDQYKLTQKINRLNETAKTWKTSEVMAMIFNQFVDNQLPEDLSSKEVVFKVLQYFRIESDEITELLKKNPLDTEALYMELVYLDGIQKIHDFNKLLFTLVRQFTIHALKQPQYQKLLEYQAPQLSEPISLSHCLNELHQALENSNLLKKDLDMESFVRGMGKKRFGPSAYLNLLQQGYLKSRFELAYATFLFCKQIIEIEAQVNQRIQGRVKLVREITTTKQDTRLQELASTQQEALMIFEQISTMVG